jgi:hypothetical protein
MNHTLCKYYSSAGNGSLFYVLFMVAKSTPLIRPVLKVHSHPDFFLTFYVLGVNITVSKYSMQDHKSLIQPDV